MAWGPPSSVLEVAHWFLLLPIINLWRDVHFYFSHRLLHHGLFYKYVHSLHHR